MASLFFVSFWAHFQNCFFRCLLPVGAVNSDDPAPPGHFSPRSLFARALSHIMPFSAPCRLLFRAARVGRRWPDGRGVALVKLVHQGLGQW